MGFVWKNSTRRALQNLLDCFYITSIQRHTIFVVFFSNDIIPVAKNGKKPLSLLGHQLKKGSVEHTNFSALKKQVKIYS
jgi:hypothetical protein